MNNCSNCRFWRKIRDEPTKEWKISPHGECNRIEEISIKDESATAWLHTIMGYLDEELRHEMHKKKGKGENFLVSFEEDIQGNEMFTESSLITKDTFYCNEWQDYKEIKEEILNLFEPNRKLTVFEIFTYLHYNKELNINRMDVENSINILFTQKLLSSELNEFKQTVYFIDERDVS